METSGLKPARKFMLLILETTHFPHFRFQIRLILVSVIYRNYGFNAQ